MDTMSHFLEHAQVFPESPREIHLRTAREAAERVGSLAVPEGVNAYPQADLVEAKPLVLSEYAPQTEQSLAVSAAPQPVKPKYKVAKFCFGGAWINIPVGVFETSKDGDAMIISFAEESSIELSQGMHLAVRFEGRDWSLRYSDVSLNFPSIPGTLHLFLVE